MSGRRKFGSFLVRSARDGHKYVQARYQPPVWAYSKWPDLPRHYTKNFDAEYTAMAEAWLAEQERLIKLGSWEPPRIEKTKELSSTITFREYALDFVQNRRKPNGQRIAPTTREKYLQYLDDYLLPVLGDKPMGSIGPRDIEKWADSMRVGKAGEGASVKHKAYVLLREIFRDACERELDQVYSVKSRWTLSALNLNTVGVQLEHHRRLVLCFVVWSVYFMRECLFR